MKKYLLLSTIFLVFFGVFSLTKVSGVDEKTIYRYETNTPILYQDGSNNPVTVPVNYIPKKQELRGAWVATVYNIDITKQSGTTSSDIQDYKNNYLDILNNLEAYNMNAVIFQVRPTNDAFYQSSLNPWSKYLIGEQGKDPGWDPLAWMVEVTHQRGMEYHAWFNPYRISTTSVSDKAEYLEGLAPKNFARLNPDLVIKDANGKLIYNPGEPRVQQFIIDTVMEVAQNYDIDAIHFDDYFYPYAGVGSNDSITYNTYNPSNLSLDDWRRENVDNVIKGIKEALTIHNQTNNKAVQFGISPFGIWSNKSHNSLGSNTNGNESYYVQYADTRKWVKEGWIDYIVPQLYWEFDKISYKDDGTQVPVAPYADLVNWWVDVVRGTKVNLYIGQGMYRYSSTGNWRNTDEIPNQLLYNQKFEEVKGTIYFSYKQLVRNDGPSSLVNGRNKVKEYYNKNDVVILPAQKNINTTKPIAPTNLTISSTSNSMELNWDKNSDAKLYAVYRFNIGEQVDTTNSSKLLDVVYPINITKVSYSDSNIQLNTIYKYVVTAFNNSYNESDITVGTSALLKPTISNTKSFHVEVKTTKPNWLEGVTAKSSLGDDLTSALVVDDSRVLINKVGTYDLIYSVTDSNDKTATTMVKVYVEDNTLPEFTGLTNITILVGSIEPDWLEGVSALDNLDGDLTSKIIVDNSLVNLNKVDIYEVTYTVTDSNGNKKVVTRNVSVVEDGKPVFNGIEDIEVDLNDNNINYLTGITASDLEDGDITNKIKVDNQNVKINKEGIYQITYSVTDSDGNMQTRTVKVHVVDHSEEFVVSEEFKYILIFSGVLFLFFVGLTKIRK